MLTNNKSKNLRRAERAKQSAFKFKVRRIKEREKSGNPALRSLNFSEMLEKAGHSSRNWMMLTNTEQSISNTCHVIALSKMLAITHIKASISAWRGGIGLL